MSARCAVCGKARRRGSSRKVAIIERGAVRAGLACGECSALAVLVAVPPAKEAAPVDDVRDVLTALARTFRGYAKIADAVGNETAGEVWHQAADMAAGRAKNPGERRLGS